MPINANKKGKRFEREIANSLNKKFDSNVRRTPQSGGMSIKGDIIDIDDNSILSDFHFECKNQEKLNIWKALRQSTSDCPLGKIPLVVFTKNFETNYACLEFEDFMNIVKELEEYRDKYQKTINL